MNARCIILRLITALLLPLKLILTVPMIAILFPPYWIVTGKDPFIEVDADKLFSWPTGNNC